MPFVRTSVNCASRSPRSGHCTEGEIAGNRSRVQGGPEAQIPGFGRIWGGLGETMVSSESVAPVRFIWVRYQPELTLPVPSRAHFRVFRPDFGLSEACILPSEQPHCVLATQNVAWPHKMWLGHTESGLATLWPGHTVAWPQCPSLGITQPGCAGGAGREGGAGHA